MNDEKREDFMGNHEEKAVRRRRRAARENYERGGEGSGETPRPRRRKRRRPPEAVEAAVAAPKKAKKSRGSDFSAKMGCQLGCSVVFLLVFIIAVIMCVHVLTLFSHARQGILNTDEKKGKEEFTTTVVIDQGDSLRTISQKLHEAGIIESPFFFRWKVGVEDAAGSLNYGEYELSNYMDFGELVEALSVPAEDGDYYKFTVIEGQSVMDIADNLEEEGICTADEFLNECDNGEFEYDFIKDIPERNNRLEGYLFPDTYFIGYDNTPWDIVDMMLSNFDNRVVQGLSSEIKKSPYTLDEIVIIASIIEKEIKLDSERPVAASVINNRLDIGMKLQMDATVLYAQQEHKGRVMYSDTEIESEYNTYYIDGLPIGPIGNAGLASFKGAVEPAQTDYLYYVVSNPETGEHYYTDDYDDFLRAKNEYISGL